MYDERIDTFLQGLPAWQKNVCSEVRRLIHEADSDIAETIKRTDRPYFTLSGNVCALQSTKDHVNVFIYDPIAPDPEGIINQGKDNTTARAIQLYKDDAINESALLDLFKAVIANNKAGGWRTLKK